VPDFRQQYNGAEQDAIITQRALKLYGLMSMAVEKAGGDLVEMFLTNGYSHPDLSGKPQDLIDEMMSQGYQGYLSQAQYLATRVFPQAQRYGIDLGNWMESTTKSKLREIVPEFRFLLDEVDASEEDRKTMFLALVHTSTLTISEIRQSKMINGPTDFVVEEVAEANGYRWFLPWLTPDTRDWCYRRLQPYGRRQTILEGEVGDRPEDRPDM